MKTKNLILTLVISAILLLGILILSFNLTGKTISQAEPLKIGIVTYIGDTPFYIAQEKEFFKKEGINAELILINDPAQLSSSLESNSIQMLVATADFTPLLVDSGIDIKEIFITDMGYGSDGLLVTKEINSLENLKGKEVYLPIGTPSDFLFSYMTKQAGLTDQINIINLGADQVGTSFLAEKIDYGMSWEPWLSKASERKDGKVLFTSRDKPGIILDTIIVRTDTLKSRRNEVNGVIKAWFDSLEFMKINPSEANLIISKNWGLPVNDVETQLSTVKFLDYNENLLKFDKSNKLNLYELTNMAINFYSKKGLIKSNLSSEEIVDSTVLKELYS